jgi:hypothetical protein
MGEKITNLFSLTSNWNLGYHSIINVVNKAVNDMWTPKMFIDFTTSHCLYFTHLNEFF